MNELFLKIINMSISASWLVLVVLLLQLLFKKAPKWVNVLLWGIVAVRLICPFSFESALSLIPSAETISPTIMMDQTPSVHTGIPVINSVINPVIGESFASAPGASANPLQIWIPILGMIWMIGVAVLLLYTAVSYWRLRGKVNEAVILRDNIYQSENVGSPFVLGIIKPKVYLPYKMDVQDLGHVVAHEQAHIRRKDHWWKPLGFLLLTIHWFNPLMWLAYVLLCRDIELACDEKVIKELGNEQRADYTQALVACSVNRRMIAACPLAFGEVGVKERVKSVMNYKKPAFWVVVLAVIACVVVAVCFLTNPKNYSQEIQVNGQIYLRQENEVETLPTGSYELGELRSILHRTKEHPSEDFSATNLDEKYAGNMLYQSGTDTSTIYLEDLSGFYIPFTVDESTPDKVTFEAEVLEIHDGYFLVAPEASWALNSADRIEVPMMNMDPALEPQIGDIIEIACSGEILETYPARLSNIYSIKVAVEASTVTKWFDYLETPDEMKWDGRLEINLPEYPDVTFRWTYGEIVAVKGNETTSLYTGMPIWNTYFCDLTGDGLPELCSTISWGSGMIDNRVMIYDYANRVSYSLEERGVSDYTLRQNESDGQLYVDKTAHVGGGLLSTGRLVFEDDCLQVLWPEKPNDNISEITDPTDDPNFAYDTAVEKIYEDERNEYFISGLYSQHIIVEYTDGTQEDIVTALNAGRATFADLDKFGIRYWAEPKGDELYNAILNAIRGRNKSDKPDGLLQCASFVMLKQESLAFDSDPPRPMEMIVYGIALHEAYGFSGHTFHGVEGSHIPTVITFEVINGEYVLKDYWTPRDGSYYASDVRDKFPDDIEDEALDTQKYVLAQKQECYDQAVRYGSVDTDYAVEYLFEVIESSPATSSRPSDYIDAHPSEYRELTYYGSYTLRYIFSRFLEGNQTGLRGHLMRAVLDDLAPEAQLRLHAETGQAYFDEWRAGAIRISEQHDMDWIKEHQPAIWLFLRMDGE